MRSAPTAPRAVVPPVPVAVGVIGAAGLAAATAPLLAYALSLAVFGVPHVVAELRYVDGRFGRRLGTTRGIAILGGIAAIVAVRALGLARGIPPMDALRLELAGVGVLALFALPDLADRPWRALAALLVAGALVAGASVDPLTTLVVLAVLHNATPVGFLAERLRGEERRRGLFLCGIAFLAVPLLLASGIPGRLLASAGLAAQGASWGTTGALDAHLGVFVPAGWRGSGLAVPLFTAAAYLQILHHATVLFVLPRGLATADGRDAPVAPWPRARVLAGALVAAGIAAALLFARDFAGTRAGYGLLAAVHAWIEVPVLLLALSGPSARRTASAPIPDPA